MSSFHCKHLLFKALLSCVLLISVITSTTSDQMSSSVHQKRHDMLSRTLKLHAISENDLHVVKLRRTTRSGEFIEYATTDPISEHTAEGHLRRRRSIDESDATENLDAVRMTQDGAHEVFFEIADGLSSSPFAGDRLHLKRNYKLISKDFVVEERSRGGTIMRRHRKLQDCHYTGEIHNHDSYSKVALSLCNGVQGVIHKDEDTYFIEPQWDAINSSSSSNFDGDDGDGHPHVIIKRSAGSSQPDADDGHSSPTGSCGNKDSSSSSSAHQRRKRSTEPRRHQTTSAERHVETMIVADKVMVGYHGRSDIEKYILTIMNIVANLYHDYSIGNAVNIIVSRIVLLTEDQPELEVSHNADKSLDSFCKWQKGINVNVTSLDSLSGLAHHDNAVLITGFDICAADNKPCGTLDIHNSDDMRRPDFGATLGLAPVGGMCDPGRSCNINEDIGLSTAFTVAHEIGHNFGMQHDGNLDNNCGPKTGEVSKIMSAQLMNVQAGPFTWSSCSKTYITDFLDSGAGDCLLDLPPQRDFHFSDELPGQLHDADEQCRFQYGPQSRQCKYGDACQELWCQAKSNRCVTNSIPAAEGTNCSTIDIARGWCNRGLCVPFGYRPTSVDGAWGTWTPWSDCSRTCGTGISSTSRSCNRPRPQNGGKYCLGDRVRHRTCNTQKCPGPETDFREEQCARFDTEPFRGKYYNWEPFVGGGPQMKPCALNCLAQGYNFYTERASAVVDGTRCYSDSLNLCIAGECHHVGCDKVLHSEAIEDKCRICGGDGSTCHTEMGVFDKPVMHGQYHDVVTIPKGSVNIIITEMQISSQNYIALKSTSHDNYINGGWTIDWPRIFDVAGTTFTYKRPAEEPESLQALGPTTEDLVVMVLLQEPNKGLRYEYNVPIIQGSGDGLDWAREESAFQWHQGDWTECSATCAGGMQSKPIFCKRIDDDTNVQQSYCNPQTRPILQTQSCNEEACPPRWVMGQWSSCTVTCGGGSRQRNVMCMRKLDQTEDEQVNESNCSDEKPTSDEQCNMNSCPPEWVAEEWSTCTSTCGPGWRSRSVTCKSVDRQLHFPENLCDAALKPITKAQCNRGDCPKPKWRVSKWGPCSAKCGRGQKRRHVKCVHVGSNRPSNQCPRPRPRSVIACESPCERPAPRAPGGRCVDDPQVNYCNLVRKYRFCQRAYFQQKCCDTCQKMNG